jgi:outer membrane protein assembly factor BamB
VITADTRAVYVSGAASGDGVYGLDARSGRTLWHHPDGQAAHGPFGDTLYVETEKGIDALDPVTGRVRWLHPEDGDDSHVYWAGSDTAVFATVGHSDVLALRAH